MRVSCANVDIETTTANAIAFATTTADRLDHGLLLLTLPDTETEIGLLLQPSTGHES